MAVFKRPPISKNQAKPIHLRQSIDISFLFASILPSIFQKTKEDFVLIEF